jgi:hypothetical protein
MTAHNKQMEEKFVDRTDLKKQILNRGWRETEPNAYTLSTDADINLWIHPYTGEILMSPKLVEHLKALQPVIALMVNEG